MAAMGYSFVRMENACAMHARGGGGMQFPRFLLLRQEQNAVGRPHIPQLAVVYKCALAKARVRGLARYPCAVTPYYPSSPSFSCSVAAGFVVGGGNGCAVVPALCGVGWVAFCADNSRRIFWAYSDRIVFSRKVLNSSSVSGMLSGNRLSNRPIRLHNRFVLSLRSCALYCCRNNFCWFLSCAILASIPSILSNFVCDIINNLLSDLDAKKRLTFFS